MSNKSKKERHFKKYYSFFNEPSASNDNLCKHLLANLEQIGFKAFLAASLKTLSVFDS